MKKLKKIFEKFLYIYFVVTFLIFLIFTYFVYESYTLSNKPSINNKIIKRAVLAYREAPLIFIGAINGYFENIKSINIKVENDEFKKIEKARFLAKKNKRLNKTIARKSSVNAEIHVLRDNAEIKNIKLKLKGDRPSHFSQKKNSSYKINLKNNEFFLGFNEFGIHKPRARNYIYEWIFHKLMGDENIVGPKYNFINLNINNENKGLYALEESLDNLVFNNNEIGPIFFWPDDLLTENDFKIIKSNNYKELLTIKSKSYWNKKENIDIKKKAFIKFYKFLDRDANIQETFDIKNIAKYMALTDLLMTYHGYSNANIRFHFNPKSNLFELVAWDGHRQNPRYHPWNELYNPSTLIELIDKKNNPLTWLKKFLFWDEQGYKIFLKIYINEIKRITNKDYLNLFFTENKKKISTYNNLIYRDFFFTDNFDKYGPSFYYFDEEEIYHRANYLIKKYL